MKNATLILGLFFLGHSAMAATTLKHVQADGTKVDLIFDGKVDRSQIQTEFFNDVIQLSIRNVNVYPAKIANLSGGSFTKVFAYQYSPRLIRTRISVKGKAEDFKGRFRLSANNRMIGIRLENVGAPTEAAAPASKGLDLDEQALLDKVLKGTASEKNPPVEKKPSRAATAENDEPLAMGKPLPNPFFAIGKLALVVGLFCGIALLVKKIKGGELGKISPDALKRFAGKLGRKEKMIEVVSTHYLGPKKSIAVVKIAGRMLVLGISNESINLITQLTNHNVEEMDMDELLVDGISAKAPAGATAEFSSVLGTESSKPTAATRPSARSQIKNRLEGLKQL